MRKFFLFSMVVTLGLVACNKNEMVLDNNTPIQKTQMQEEMIPIAKLNDKNEIELLFLQRDAQEFFAKENPDEKLIFVEVQDDNKDGKNAVLLYRIFNEKEEVTETSISFIVTLEDGIYYAPSATTLQTTTTTKTTVTCSTSSIVCQKEPGACQPKGLECTRCPGSITCTRGITNTTTTRVVEVVKSVAYAVFAMY